jgi:hypothetical protein
MSDDIQITQAEHAKPTAELGATGLLAFAGNIEEAYLAELRYPAAYAKFNEMRRRDPTIASMLNAIALLARTASWTVEPAGSSEPDKAAAAFLEQCIGDMSHTLEDCAEDLLSAIPFGWAWSEIVYKRRKGTRGDSESKYDDGKIGWRKFAPRRQSSFYKWELDESGGVNGLWQTIALDAKCTRYMPIDKSLHFVAQRDMGNPEGLPILEHAYEPWHFVKNLQIIMGIGWERSFVGLPKFVYGTPENPYQPTADDKAIVERTGKGLRVDEKAFVALPGQIGFELLSTANQGAATLLDTIRQFRISILQILLADFIALGTTAAGGSYSLGQDKSALFLLAVDGWLDKLAHPDKLGIFNRYAVPRLFKYNTFDGITDYPRIVHSSVQKPNLQAMASYLNSLGAFIRPDAVLEAHLRQQGGFPQADDDSRFETPQAPPEEMLPRGDDDDVDDDASPDDAEPETGEEADAEMAAALHPPARGQKWHFLAEWRKLKGEFRDALNRNYAELGWVTVNGNHVYLEDEDASPRERTLTKDPLHQAYADWTGNRMHVDGAGNYRMRSGKIHPLNKEIKKAFKDVGDFHKVAHQHIGELDSEMQTRINKLWNEHGVINPLPGYYKPNENKRRKAKQSEIENKIAEIERNRKRLTANPASNLWEGL